MLDLKYRVKGQSVVAASQLRMFKGSNGFMRMTFDFGQDWQHLKQRVIGFKTDGEFDYFPLKNDSIVIPDEYCNESFDFALVGFDGRTKVFTKTYRQEVV